MADGFYRLSPLVEGYMQGAADESPIRGFLGMYEGDNGHAHLAMLRQDTGGGTVEAIDVESLIDAVTPVVLFEGDYSETYNHSVTISESAANFARLTVMWVTSDGNYGSTDVFDPDGKTFATVAVNIKADSTVCYIKFKNHAINGTTIDTANPSSWQRAEISIWGSGTSINTTDFIGITKVLGWRS